MGQVNAGKSSFLNVLLFNAEEIFSKESIRKTVNLTKINYSDKNKLVVEFSSEDEWNELKEMSARDDEKYIVSIKNFINEVQKILVDIKEKTKVIYYRKV